MPKKWTDEQCQEITLGASRYHDNAQIAMVDEAFKNGRAHYVHCPEVDANREPHSPVTRLIQALVSERRGGCLDQNVIYTNVAPTEMCIGMAANLGAKVKLIQAKKTLELNDDQYDRINWSSWWNTRSRNLTTIFGCGGKGPSPLIDLTQEERTGKHAGYHSVHRVYMMVACALIAKRASTQFADGQNIGAVLVSKQGEILAWGINTHDSNGNQTYHAEVNMLQSYYALCGDTYAGLPEDCRIYTTLKPCKMCAGMIVKCATGRFKVFYEQSDPGGLARGTALDGNSSLMSSMSYGSVRDIIGVATAESNSRVSKPRMGSQMDAQYRKTQDSRKKLSDEKRITAFVTEDPFATRLFGNAAKSLRDKLKKHGILGDAANPQALNPVVTKALGHVHGFLTAKGVL